MSTDKSRLEYPHSAIAKSASVIGLGTLISRFLGFIRDMVIARVLGTDIYAQAFAVAFKIPNLFRDLLGEGAANAAIVPVFSEYAARDSREEYWEKVNIVFNALMVALAAITLLGILLSPLIVRLIAPGFAACAEKLEATIRLNRIIFPYVLLICLAAYSTGILNSLQHFSVPAFAPCLLNISIIFFAWFIGEGIAGLALGVLIGGILQLAVQLPLLYQKGFRFKYSLNFKHPAVKKISKLMAPRVLNSGIYQLNNFVDSIFGSLAWIVGEAGVAVLYFSYRLIQFPIGIFSNALSQALLPTFSAQAIIEDQRHLQQTLSWGLRAIFFLMLPISILFMVLASPIIQTLFGGGRFGPDSVQLTAQALFFYSIGLAAYGMIKIEQSCFFALKDTVTPTKVSFIALIMNIILNSILIFPLKIGGIALATSISGIVSFIILSVLLKKRIGTFKIDDILISFSRIFFASIGMGLVCYLLAQKQLFLSSTTLNKFLNLSLLLCAGVISYIIFCWLFRVKEMRELWQWIRRNK